MGTSDPALPVDSYRDAAAFLRRPFTPEAVKFKPQSVTKSGKTMCVAYIDARLVAERLNLVCPHLWEEPEYEHRGPLLLCSLTVDGLTRRDVGEGNGKALYSDAFKRAAVKFGIGVSLYTVPANFIDGQVKFLTDRHTEQLRLRYRKWLEAVGVRAFGEPFDHGDVEDSAGDADTGETAPEPDPLEKLAGVADFERSEKPSVDLAPLVYIAAAIRAKDKKALTEKQWEAWKTDAEQGGEAFRLVGEALAAKFTEVGGDIDALREQYKNVRAAA